MPVVHTSIDLDAPPEKVWEVVSDLDRTGDWVTIHRGFPEGAPAFHQGAEFKQTIEVAGASFDVTWQLADVREPELVEWNGVGPAGTKARSVYRLHAANGGTRFDYENEFTLPGGSVGEAVGSVLDGRAKREADESLEKLRSIVT